MFKNYLSYQFALSFHQKVQLLNLPNPLGQELERCSKNVVHYFTQSLHDQDQKDRAKNLFVALTYMRDCRDLLDTAKKNITDPTEIEHYWEILHSRLERLCLESAEKEGGQLRMLG